MTTVDSAKPSPFASALLFSYIANYIYEGDAPLAERRAQALAIDQSQLQELLGDTDLRELLDAAALDEVEAQLQALDPEYQARHADGVHDLLLQLGDLTASRSWRARCVTPEVAASVDELVHTRRVLRVRIAGEPRFIAVEYAARYRDAFGVPLPPGLPEVWLENVGRPAAVDRAALCAHARAVHHGRAGGALCAGLVAAVEPAAARLAWRRQVAGRRVPSRRDASASGAIPRCCARSGARRWRGLRREIEPVEAACARAVAHALARRDRPAPRDGRAAGCDRDPARRSRCPPRSWSARFCPRGSRTTRSSDLDTLMAAGEVVWVGVERIGERDGRVALYLSENLPQLLPPRTADMTALVRARAPHLAALGAQRRIVLRRAAQRRWRRLRRRDARRSVGAGLGRTGHQRHACIRCARSCGRPTIAVRVRPPPMARRARPISCAASAPAPGRAAPAKAAGRWCSSRAVVTSPTEWIANTAQQLLVRYGVVRREAAAAENIAGGYSAIYPALRTMEESGWIRRGMFVAGMGAAQFAMNSAVEMLRSLRNDPEAAEAVHLAATDPANPYGALLPWPRLESEEPGYAARHGARQRRQRGDGERRIGRISCAGAIRRCASFLPENEPDRSRFARALASKLAEVALQRQTRRGGLLIGEINGEPAREHFLARFLLDAGFVDTALGFQMRRVSPTTLPVAAEPPDAELELDEETHGDRLSARRRYHLSRRAHPEPCSRRPAGHPLSNGLAAALPD